MNVCDERMQLGWLDVQREMRRDSQEQASPLSRQQKGTRGERQAPEAAVSAAVPATAALHPVCLADESRQPQLTKAWTLPPVEV